MLAKIRTEIENLRKKPAVKKAEKSLRKEIVKAEKYINQKKELFGLAPVEPVKKVAKKTKKTTKKVIKKTV